LYCRLERQLVVGLAVVAVVRLNRRNSLKIADSIKQTCQAHLAEWMCWNTYSTQSIDALDHTLQGQVVVATP
jgi:hypothetical protein